MSSYTSINVTTSEHSEIAPADDTPTGSVANATVAVEVCNDDAPPVGERDDFPEVGPVPLRVPVNVGPHKSETDVEIGCTRLRILIPFVLSRLGMRYEVWDAQKQSMVQTDRKLSVRQHVAELSKRLACGTDLVFEWVSIIAKKGPENVVGDDLLKTASSGGKGVSRLGKDLEKALTEAVFKVCVTDGIKPGSRKANQAIRAELTVLGYASKLSTATLNHRAHSKDVAKARTDAYERDHLQRIAGQSDDTPGLNSVVVMDSTLFTDEDADLRVVDSQGRDLGPANVIFALLKANRGVWSFRAFAGPQNSFLAGLTVKRGLVSKTALLERHKIPGVWPHHGKVGTINHDCGSEFVGGQVQGAIKRRGIAINDRSPPNTPHFRGGLERFNRTAHLLFSEFLESDCGKRYLRPVNGRPNAKGILLSDLDKALIEWIVGHYHVRPHAGLGGDTPFGRMEKYIRGINGLATSGLPMSLEDTDELKWDFLWEETRTVTHLGIQFNNRRYSDPVLKYFFKPNSRSSECKITFRFHPYAMGHLFVKIPDENGKDKIWPIRWWPETERYRASGPNQEASINPSLWEWGRLFDDIRLANTTKATPELAEALFAKREAEAAAANGKTSGKKTKEKISTARERAMRETMGLENLPGTAASVADDAGEVDPKPGEPLQTLRLLDTRAGADAY